MAKKLDRYCGKQLGTTVNKAPACTKDDLRILVEGLYFATTSAKEYQDAALLVLMWHSFGRVSELTFVRKSGLSVAANNVLFLRFVRPKTSEEQGISLFPDHESYVTCPVHAIAVAAAMQTFPNPSHLDHPQLCDDAIDESLEISSGLALAEALNMCNYEPSIGEISNGASRPGQSQPGLKIHAYVNRVVKAVSASQARVGITTALSSHSFRRGRAQHANSDPNLRAQWIFDRGSWNMTATNKAFAYVFNTTTEDQKVAKVMSGWQANDRPSIPSLGIFDSVNRTKVKQLGHQLFISCVGLLDSSLNFDARTLKVLTASLVQHFPEINNRYPTSQYATRMRACCFALNISMTDLLGWSHHIQQHALQADVETEPSEVLFTKEERIINQQNILVSELLTHNRELVDRVKALEERLSRYEAAGVQIAQKIQRPTQPPREQEASSSDGVKQSRAAAMSASAIWFE